MSTAKQDRAIEAAMALVHAVSQMGFDNEAFAAEITSQHRTHQQSVMRAFASCINKWAEMHRKGDFDARNEATTELCAKIMKEHRPDFYFPFI